MTTGQQTVARQASFADLGTLLVDVTFVVVDLETTGGSPAAAAITEIGAVKVRGGEPLGEFHTLVNPQTSIPPFIAVLTGITEAMVATAPGLAAVLPDFLGWAGTSVLVAHNAPFDLGFLRAGCSRLDLAWPGFDSVDTARLARRVLTRDEAPDCRLATLARLFRTSATPTHRALDDARATVDVLHGLIARLGGLGVHTLEELRAFSSLVTPALRRKRRLAEGLPHAPGVYMFRDGRGRILYVGKSRDVATRVRSYFAGSERRARIAEMVGIAERVDYLPCAHGLEADVRELRLIAEHKPPYNKRSRFPERASYLVLTDEPFPRLSILRRSPATDTVWLGPFPSARAAELARDAVHETFPLRRCTPRLARGRPRPRCALADLGRCPAPCDGELEVEDYRPLVDAVAGAMRADPEPVIDATRARIRELVSAERFEEAGSARDRLACFLRAAVRRQRLTGLLAVGRLVAAQPADGGYDFAVVEAGRLIAADASPAGSPPARHLTALLASLPAVRTSDGSSAGPPGADGSAEEMECVLSWLERPGTRLVQLDGVYACPLQGPLRWRGWLEQLAGAAGAADPLADRRRIRPQR
ncbi:MAG TPA: DEDD exonuclease domain-containing protein [Mycobacteriales bacterium]|nr:DEDD exonuclease domain-containing protein [Mycobacteriales bacterium]